MVTFPCISVHLGLLSLHCPQLKNMTYLSSIADLLALLLFLASIWAVRDYRRRRGLPYPPGPRPLPIIGNMLDIPKQFSWLAYSKFSETYGTPISFAEVRF